MTLVEMLFVFFCLAIGGGLGVFAGETYGIIWLPIGFVGGFTAAFAAVAGVMGLSQLLGKMRRSFANGHQRRHRNHRG